jgi:hypothetical protein
VGNAAGSHRQESGWASGTDPGLSDLAAGGRPSAGSDWRWHDVEAATTGQGTGRGGQPYVAAAAGQGRGSGDWAGSRGGGCRANSQNWSPIQENVGSICSIWDSI